MVERPVTTFHLQSNQNFRGSLTSARREKMTHVVAFPGAPVTDITRHPQIIAGTDRKLLVSESISRRLQGAIFRCFCEMWTDALWRPRSARNCLRRCDRVSEPRTPMEGWSQPDSFAAEAVSREGLLGTTEKQTS